VTGTVVGRARMTTTNEIHANEARLTTHIRIVPLPRLNGPGLNLTYVQHSINSYRQDSVGVVFERREGSSLTAYFGMVHEDQLHRNRNSIRGI
jgi:hypothetical protein